jgi:hypothetical protein
MKLLPFLLAIPMLAQQTDHPKKAEPKPHVAARLPTVGWRPPAERTGTPKPAEQKPNVAKRPPFVAWRPAPARTVASAPATQAPAAQTTAHPSPIGMRNPGYQQPSVRPSMKEYNDLPPAFPRPTPAAAPPAGPPIL